MRTHPDYEMLHDALKYSVKTQLASVFDYVEVKVDFEGLYSGSWPQVVVDVRVRHRGRMLATVHGFPLMYAIDAGFYSEAIRDKLPQRITLEVASRLMKDALDAG